MITRNSQGFTLIEMVMVIVIIGVIASIAMKSLQASVDQKRFDDTVAEMDKLSRAIVGDERLISGGMRTDFGYVGDIGALPSSLAGLVTNPGYSTWKGPYIENDFSEDIGGYAKDAWNEPYTYSGGITIGSNGGGEPITRSVAASANELTSNTVKGIIRDKALSPPGDSAGTVTVNLVYPDGAGAYVTASTAPGSSGEFSFVNAAPIGIHLLRAIAGADTVAKYIAVYPGKVAHTELRFARDKW
jgi:general secretion pathway protein G